jgi:hypothetical protein
MSIRNLKSRGVSPDNFKNNARIINRAIEDAKDGDTILYPSFDDRRPIPLLETIVQNNKTLYHEGDGLSQLKIVHTSGPGMLITQKYTIERSRFTNLRLINDMKGDFPNCHGIECSVPASFEDVKIENFLGHGLFLWAYYKGQRPGDVSNIFCKTVTVFSCKGDGIRLLGIEANAGLYEQIIVSSNYGYGINDKSGLGNRFIACTAHGNRKGDYKATESVSSANFIGCYSEGTGTEDPTYSHFAGFARVIEGTWGSSFILDDHASAEMNGKKIYSKFNVDKTPQFYIDELREEEAIKMAKGIKADAKVIPFTRENGFSFTRQIKK